MSDPSCSIHGTEHVRAVRVSPQLLGHRCAADTEDGTKCGRIALPPTFGAGYATWSEPTHSWRRDDPAGDGTRCVLAEPPPPHRLSWHIRIYDRLPERATVECIMCTLVIGFWITALFWAPILFERLFGP